uniref:Ubiquitin-like domain-containing protein n=1 Tax=Poecilia formosa TaxID=48698 RepID=A0A096M3Z0_POEFO
MGEIYQVVVQDFTGKKICIDLCHTEEEMQRFTVGQLKEKITEKLPEAAGKLREEIRLTFADKRLEGDTSLLSEYGIHHLSIIWMVTIPVTSHM